MRPEESFIAQPIRSLQTMLRVIAQDEGTLPTLVPDGIYGQDTMKAVTEFQRREGLPLTGVTDQRTWEAIVRQYEPAQIRVGQAESIEIIMDPGQVYQLGDTGAYIGLMQSMLIWLSGSNSAIREPKHTGIFDIGSKAALTDFQALAGLPETGQLDKITWKHLSRQFTLSAHHTAHRTVRDNS